MRVEHVACCLLLLAMVVVSGCQEPKGLVGRWDMGRSNFYFRKDGVAFYTSTSQIKYQGRYYYDDASDPGTVRAELQEVNSNPKPLTLELLVTFLSPDRVRFDGRSGGRDRSMIASRIEESPARD